MDNKAILMYRVKKYLKILSVALLFLLIGLLVYEYIKVKPKDVHFTNVTSSSVTVSWTTKSAISASIIHVEEKDKLPLLLLPSSKNKSYDIRDVTKSELAAVAQTEQNISENTEQDITYSNFQSEPIVTERGKYYTHSVEVKGLDPESSYSFFIGDSLIYTKVKDNEGNIAVKTTAMPESIKTPYPAYGSVKNADNKGDVPIEELEIISDGIIYFNFLDNETGERSLIFSSILNESGNWYIDISSATNANGNWFLDDYAGTEDVVFVELKLNAGPLGVWERKESLKTLNPTLPFIINSPDEATEESVNKVSYLPNELVKGVMAETYTVGVCYFIGYCGGCQRYLDTGYFESCECDEDTLTARNCTGFTDQETLTCSGGYSIDETILYNGVCKTCKVFSQNGYDYAKWEEDSSQEIVNGKCQNKAKAENTVKNNEVCTEETCICEANNETISRGESCTDGQKKSIGDGEACDDRDGCYCMGEDAINYADYDYTCSTNSASQQSSINAGVICTFTDECTCPDGSVVNRGESCPSSSAAFPTIHNNTVCWNVDSSCTCEIDGSSKTVAHGGRCTDEQRGTGANGERCTDLDGCVCPNGDMVDALGTCLSDEAASEDETPTSTQNCWESSGYQMYRSDGSTAEKCTNGVWEDAANDSAILCKLFLNGESNSCSFLNYLTICVDKDTGQRYYCPAGTSEWIPVDDEEADEVIAVEVPLISAGTKCTGQESEDGNNVCACQGGADNNKTVEVGEFCREVAGGQGCTYVYYGHSYPEKEGDATGLVCKHNGTTCAGEKSYWDCNGDKKSSLVNNNSTPLLSIKLDNKVLGIDETSGSQYIIDSQTGMFTNISEGVYTFEYNGKYYVFVINEDQDSVLIYIDENDNGKYDDGDILVSELASTVNIVAVSQKYEYTLIKGFNFISTPFLIENTEARTAAGLLEKLNEVYGDVIYSIAKYDGTWKIVGQNVKVYDSNNFQLVPGQGYIIKAKKNVDISIVGQPVKYESEADNAPVTLYKGWNLVGLYGTNVKQYTAKSMLQDINNFSKIEFTANNVTRWESDAQKYDGYQLDNENGIDIEYGFDFPINLLNGYFVRVQDGSGNWQPDFKE